MKQYKIIYMAIIIFLNGHVFGALGEEKPRRPVGLFPRHAAADFMRTLEEKSRSEEPTSENPMGIVSLGFSDQKTLTDFQSLPGDLSLSIIPLLAEEPTVTRSDGFYEGEAKGLPYTVTYPEKSRKCWKPSLEVFLMISTFCDPLPDGAPGHYYLWDRHQVIRVDRFSISVMVDGRGETTLVSSDKPLFFPISPDHMNDRKENRWSMVNIALKHIGEKWNEGWSSTLSLINHGGVSIDPIVFRPSPILTKRELLRMAARHNGKGGPAHYQIVELDEDGYEMGAPKPKPLHVKKTMEEDGAESEED